MKRKTIFVICIILLVTIVLGLLGFFGMRNNFLGIRNLVGYKKVAVYVVSSDAPTEASIKEFFTRASSLQQLLDENADDFEFVLGEGDHYKWKDKNKHSGTNSKYEIAILTVEDGINKQEPAPETVLTDELTDDCNYLFKLYTTKENVVIGG